ncbi:hypothetical protein, partial [Escherichia coli]
HECSNDIWFYVLVGSKYEEICAPQVEEFCYITDNTYFKEEVWVEFSCGFKLYLFMYVFEVHISQAKSFDAGFALELFQRT